MPVRTGTIIIGLMIAGIAGWLMTRSDDSRGFLRSEREAPRARTTILAIEEAASDEITATAARVPRRPEPALGRGADEAPLGPIASSSEADDRHMLDGSRGAPEWLENGWRASDEELEPEGSVERLAALVRRALTLSAQLQALQSLVATAGEDATIALLGLGHDAGLSVRVRAQAVLGLSARADDRARGAMDGFLAAQDPQVRIAALRAIGSLPGPDSEWVVEAAVRNDANPKVRRAGFEALARIGTRTSVEILLGFLGEGADVVRGDRPAILWSLGSIARPDALPGLLVGIQSGVDREVHSALIRALGGIGDSRALGVLVDVAGDASMGEARLHAINGLGLIGDTRILPILTDLLEADDERQQWFARTAIQRIFRD